MGQIKKAPKVKLFIGILSGDAEIIKKVKKLLEIYFGNIDFQSDLIDFNQTNYYKDEMGDGLKRVFFSFKKHCDLNNIYKVKIKTNKIENKFLCNGKRIINIDPGYLDQAKLVLFSTKDFSHRIYLSNGIYAEITLQYQNKTYNILPWTYPDYRTKKYTDIFLEIRKLYKDAIICS